MSWDYGVCVYYITGVRCKYSMTDTELKLWREAQHLAWRDLACDESRWPKNTYMAVTVNYYTELLKKHVARELTANGSLGSKK